jgi:autotransporter-associated beta strand protein
VVLNGNLTFNVENDLPAIDVEINGIVSGAYSFTKNALGTLKMGGGNTYTGSTIISDGILLLGASERIANASNVILNNGTLKTGATIGFTETFGTLNVNGIANIVLGTGTHSLLFANSSAEAWAGTSLTITGWTGTGGNSGLQGKVFVGVNGLTSAQLAQISFNGFAAGAQLLGTGEIVPESSLPIKLTEFKGTASLNSIVIDWQTATESNNDFFTLYRSFNGIEFSAIGDIAGEGNSDAIKNYSYIDEISNSGIVYYRLVQTDYNGTTTVSKTIAISSIANNPTFLVIGNEVTLNFNQANGNSLIEITNVEGETVFTKTYVNCAAATITLPVQKGVYFITLQKNNVIFSQKVVL